MRSALLFDFTVNKENNTIEVKREFDANLELVWEAWTNPEIIDQWWAPKPWQAETKSMDFREGGFWLYAMVGPENQKHWSRQDYQKIVFQKSFSGTDTFCDENGNYNTKLPKTYFENIFAEADGKTLVTITSRYESFTNLEQIIDMGFKEGFTKALENLDQFLSLKKIPKDKTVSINLPVEDLQKSMDFYSALGFENYPYTLGDTVRYMFWSQHISLTLMTREKFSELIPKSLANTKQTMGSFFTLSVSSLDELNDFITRGLNAGGIEPNEMDDYGFMYQRTIEDFDGHCWNVMFIDHSKMEAEPHNG